MFLNRAARQKFFQGEAQAGGQKGRGSGGRNFCPPAVSGWWVGVRRRRRRTSQSEFFSKKVRTSFSNCGLQSEIEIAIDNAISTTGDDMFSLEYMFVMLWQERTVLVENICNDMDDSYNSGTMLPTITINIKGKEDIERARRIITLLRLFYSIAETAPGGG